MTYTFPDPTTFAADELGATVPTHTGLHADEEDAIVDLDSRVTALAAAAVLKALYDANTILIATTDNTPTPLTVAASRIIGRKSSGDIDALTAAEAKTILAIASTDVSDFAAAAYAATQTINAQSGTTYTIATDDPGKLVTQSNGSAITTTVPQDSDVTFAVGKWCELYQLGAGQITVVAGTGATLRATPTAKARAQYSRLFLQKISANTWALSGDLAAS